MGMLANVRNRIGKFVSYVSGYDAVNQPNKRRMPPPNLKREDDHLRAQQRKQLIASTQNVHRNFAVARWAIARHLDYVSTFSFQARTGNKQLDAHLERLTEQWSRPESFEVTARFSRQKFTRLAEMMRTIWGDFGILKIRNRKVQGIEGDLIRSPNGGFPPGYHPQDFLHGVKLNRYGKAVAYCLCKRGKSSDISPGSFRYEFERVVPARNLYHFSYWDRFDQARGVTPLACAVNSLVDCYEGIDYALGKMKVSQLFALSLYRQRMEGDALGEIQVPEGADEDDLADATAPAYTKLDFSKGPQMLDLPEGARAEILESHTPSSEFQSFTQTTIALTLKALDIPFSFFDESFTNYSGARQALLQYEASATIKRQDIVALLDHLFTWRAIAWINDGCLPQGVKLSDLRWRWVPLGQPWIDPLKEMQAKLSALSAGLTSRQREALDAGEDWFDIVDELAAESDYLKSKGLPTDVNPGNVTINEVAGK